MLFFKKSLVVFSAAMALLCCDCQTVVKASETSENLITLEQAVKIAVENNTDLFISQKQIDVSEGAEQSAAGAFDRQVSTSVSYSNSKAGIFDDDTDLRPDNKVAGTNTSYNMNYSKKSRSGQTIGATVSTLQELDNKIPSQKRHNTGNVNMNVTIPLGQGKGKAVTTAPEKAAKKTTDASRHDYNQQLASLILNVSAAYWDYMADFQKLEILKDAEKRNQKIVENAKNLARKKIISKNELDALIGSLNDKTHIRIQVENACRESSEKLSLLLGVYTSKAFNVPCPADKFPEVPKDLKLSNYGNFEMCLNKAFTLRPDYLAAEARLKSAEFTLVSAKDAVRPGVNLQLGAGYTGIDNGTSKTAMFTSLNNNLKGANATASVTYQWPSDNNSAKGNFKQQKAAFEQANARYLALKKQIKSSLAVAYSNLQKSIDAFQSANDAVSAYLKSADHESAKYSSRKNSSIDMITIEDRLTSAKINAVDASCDYAKSLLNFKYELGLVYGVYYSDKIISFKELTSIEDITSR